MLDRSYLNKIVKEPYCRTIFDISFISAFLSFFFKLLEKDVLLFDHLSKIVNNIFIIAPLIMGFTVSYVLNKKCKIYKKEEILVYCLAILLLLLSYGLYREIGDSFLLTSKEDMVKFMFEKSFIYVTSLVLFYCLYLFFNYSYVKRNSQLFSKMFERFYLTFETILGFSFVGLLFFRILPSGLDISATYIFPLFYLIYSYMRGLRGIILRKTLPLHYFKNKLKWSFLLQVLVIIVNIIYNYLN